MAAVVGTEPGRVANGGSLAVDLDGELGRESRLAHPWRAGEDDEPRRAVAGLLPAVAQPRQLGVAPGERRRRRGLELVRELLGGREIEPRVLLQDGRLHGAELGSGLHADLLGQLLPRLAVGVERLGLAPAAVERDHQLAGEPLARRILRHQLPQLRYELGMPAGGGVGLDAQLERAQALFLEPRDLGLGERLERQVGERRAAPQAGGLAQQGRRLVRAARRQGAAALLDELREALGVQLARLHTQPVAGRRRGDYLVVAERLAQAGDVHLNGPDRARRCVLAPQRTRKALGTHRLIGMQKQNGENSARLIASQGDDAVIAEHLEGAKDPEFHSWTDGRRYSKLLSDCKRIANAGTESGLMSEHPNRIPFSKLLAGMTALAAAGAVALAFIAGSEDTAARTATPPVTRAPAVAIPTVGAHWPTPAAQSVRSDGGPEEGTRGPRRGGELAVTMCIDRVFGAWPPSRCRTVRRAPSGAGGR